MGEGLYRSPDSRTAYAEPYDDDLDPEDVDLWTWAYDDLVATVRSCLGSSWQPVAREWRGRGERVVARNGLHEVWLYQDSYVALPQGYCYLSAPLPHLICYLRGWAWS